MGLFLETNIASGPRKIGEVEADVLVWELWNVEPVTNPPGLRTAMYSVLTSVLYGRYGRSGRASEVPRN